MNKKARNTFSRPNEIQGGIKRDFNLEILFGDNYQNCNSKKKHISHFGTFWKNIITVI